MRRRKLVATAGALSATAFAATVAIGANFGLVGEAQPSSAVGRLDPQAPAAHAVAADATTDAPADATAERPTATIPADD